MESEFLDSKTEVRKKLFYTSSHTLISILLSNKETEVSC